MKEIDTNNQPETASEVVLDNYSSEVRTKDGLHVVRIYHTEYMEEIPQPPTPEEIAAAKREERIGLAVAGGLLTLFFSAVGWVAWLDSKNQRERIQRVREEDSSSS